MDDDNSGRGNPLSPYYLSAVPAVPGNTPKWFAILVLLWILLSGLPAVVLVL